MEFLRCPIDDSFGLLGKRWAGPVLMELLNGHTRFNSLLASVPGLNPRTLSARLDDFENCGIVTRESTRPSFGTTGTRVHYQLTRKGEDLRPLLRQVTSFSLKWYSNHLPEPSKRPTDESSEIAHQ
jgi:DNA-binding HxlR family transcriptional regulator